MASCQEGQAYSVAGLARNTASASTANLTTTFFMTISLYVYSILPSPSAKREDVVLPSLGARARQS